MKYVYMLFGILLFPHALHAQDLRIKVKSGEELLAYAYVFVNGKIYGSADSCGTIRIPKAILKQGDTLSASYVGTMDHFIIYDHLMAKKEEVAIELIQNNFLKGTTVTFTDKSMAYFRRYVNKRGGIGWYEQLSGDFKITQHKTISGTFSWAILGASYVAVSGDREVNIKTEADTSGFENVSNILRECIVMSQYSVMLKKGIVFNSTMRILYKGEQNNHHVFLIARPFLSKYSASIDTADKESWQSLIYVNMKSHEVEHAEIYWLKNWKGVALRMNLNAQYSVFELYNTTRLLPHQLKGSVSYARNGIVKKYDVELNNISHQKFKIAPKYKAMMKERQKRTSDE